MMVKTTLLPLLLLLAAVAATTASAFDLHQPQLQRPPAAAAGGDAAFTVPTARLLHRRHRRSSASPSTASSAPLKAMLLRSAEAPAEAAMMGDSAGVGGVGEDLAQLLAAQPLLRHSNRRLGDASVLAAEGKLTKEAGEDGEGSADLGRFAWGRVANISLGTPPRPHLLDVDLNMDVFWVLHRGLSADPRLLHRPKQPYRDDLSHTSDVTGTILPILGGAGRVVVARDTVTVGGASAKNVSFGAAFRLPPVLLDDDYAGFSVDGVFGLGLNPMRQKVPSPVRSVVAALPRPVFTLYRRPSAFNLSAYGDDDDEGEGEVRDGALTLGGENGEDCSAGSYRYVNYTLNRDAGFAPETPYRGIRVAGGEREQPIPSPPRRAVFLDGLGVYVRHAEARALAEAVGGRPAGGRSSSFFEVDCERVRAGQMPPVTLQLGEDAASGLELTLRHYTATIEDTCLLLFIGVHSSQRTPVMVGMDTLQDRCVANQVVERRLGFADGRPRAQLSPPV